MEEINEGIEIEVVCGAEPESEDGVEIEIATYDDLAEELARPARTQDGQFAYYTNPDDQEDVRNEFREALGAEPSRSELLAFADAYRSQIALACESRAQ